MKKMLLLYAGLLTACACVVESIVKDGRKIMVTELTKAEGYIELALLGNPDNPDPLLVSHAYDEVNELRKRIDNGELKNCEALSRYVSRFEKKIRKIMKI